MPWDLLHWAHAAYDRDLKFSHSRSLPSLEEYVQARLHRRQLPQRE
jgi:hypothetical protein